MISAIDSKFVHKAKTPDWLVVVAALVNTRIGGEWTVKLPVIVLLTQLPPVTIWYLYWIVGVLNVVDATIDPDIKTCVPVIDIPRPVGKLFIEGPPLAE